MDRILGTLIYARQDGSPNGDRRVLMLHRSKEPNKGLWVAPGGKVEIHESPLECAIRELHEETGSVARNLSLRGLVTEISPREDYQWLLFIYVTDQVEGDLIACSEGQLAWVNVSAVLLLPIPQADAIFFPHVISENELLYQARYTYDAGLNLVQVEEFVVEEDQ
jgi:8-oxo-dGTP diphosphatase